ncbi:3'-5' exonuclease [Akkermansiaceae bacterium]|nr:3'-5' exonuclease [Akkermansiaceae bacterium]
MKNKPRIIKEAPDSPFGKRSFCLLDIETTGLSTDSCEITEIAVIRVDERFAITGEMSRLVRISGKVPWHITGITGITDALLRAEGQPLAAVLDETWDFMGRMPSYAHNASFDRRFLDANALRSGKDFRFPLECSIPVFKRLLPGRKGFGLTILAEHLRVSGGGAHRALADCRVLLGCLRKAHGITASI